MYWKQYQYCVTIIQPKISILRGGRDATKIDAAIKNRQYWEQQDIAARRYLVNMSDTPSLTALSEQVIADLHVTAAYLKNLDVPNKLVFYGSKQCWLYTNSVDTIETLQMAAIHKSLPFEITEIRKCLPVLPQDTIMLNDPKHRFRTYFKERRITDTAARDCLVSWIQEQESAREIAASPSVKYWIRQLKFRNECTRSHWYIDHNHKSYESMMSLVCPGLVRKTVNLQRR